MVDETDKQILRSIQRNARLSTQDIASETAIPAATCWRRLKALEQNGVITAYKAVLDREQLGFSVMAFIHLTVERQQPDIVKTLERQIRERPEVLECFATTGDADFTLCVVASDIRDYDRFLQSFLFTLPGIGQVRSSIALREVKHTTDLPV